MGPTSGTKRVLRGGAWDSTADKCRAAYRFSGFPDYSDACFGADSYGFRRARNLDESGKQVVANPVARKERKAEKQIVRPMPELNPPNPKGVVDSAHMK